MYFVSGIAFDDVLDAVEYCKSRPGTAVVTKGGQVLMHHVEVEPEIAQQIHAAKTALSIQCKTEI